MAPQSAEPRPLVFVMAVRNKASLYAAYIPWLKQGGMFVPTDRAAHIGDEVLVVLELLDDPLRIPISGHVAWLTPANAHGNRTQGIGVRFNDLKPLADLKKRIENVLGGALQSSRPTHTI